MTMYPISATEPDWSRERLWCWWDPAPQLLRAIRNYQKWKQRGLIGNWVSKYYALSHKFWSVVAAADIPVNSQLGGGLILRHPNGVVIHQHATVGPNCLIFQQVTLVSGVKVGGHVDIGAGAKVIRPVTIGDHAKIGANAVVLCDVPPGATAVGIPAKIILANTTADQDSSSADSGTDSGTDSGRPLDLDVLQDAGLLGTGGVAAAPSTHLEPAQKKPESKRSPVAIAQNVP